MKSATARRAPRGARWVCVSTESFRKGTNPWLPPRALGAQSRIFSGAILPTHQCFPALCHAVEENSLVWGQDENNSPKEIRGATKPTTSASVFQATVVTAGTLDRRGYC